MIITTLVIIFSSGASFLFGAFYGKHIMTEMAQNAMLDYMMFVKSKIGQERYDEINADYIKSIGLKVEVKQ